MDRFELEILSQPSANDLPRVVIGSNTFSQVSAQLKMLRAQSGMSFEERQKKQEEVANQLKALRASTEVTASKQLGRTDRDSNDEIKCSQSTESKGEPPPRASFMDLPLLPPPPPPPSITMPSFVPPQLRHRPPPPPPPPRLPSVPGQQRMRLPPPPPNARMQHPYGGPMGPGHMPGQHGPGFYPPGPPHPGPPHAGPPHPGHMGGPGPMRMHGPPGPMGFRPNFMQSPGPRPMMTPMDQGQNHLYAVSTGEAHAEMDAAIEDHDDQEDKPKVIYSSAAVLTVPKSEKKKRKKKSKVQDEGTESNASTEASKADAKPKSEMVAGPAIASTTGAPSTVTKDLDVNCHVADMEIDNLVTPAKKEKKEKKKKFIRMAAGTAWEDQSLAEWDQEDFRLFCGDLGNEVTDEVLARAFSKYPSFIKAKVVRDKRSNKTKGYGFVSFKDPNDYVRAMREMNGKYVGNRPIKLRKSNWKDRNIEIVKKKEREKKRLGLR